MSETAQFYQKLLDDAIRKQMTILGSQITLLKARNVTSLTITDDGKVAAITGDPEEAVTRFLEEFRDLSSSLVKKTMQPLLSAIGPSLSEATAQTTTVQPKPNQEAGINNQGEEKLVPKP